jgi:hypothetical protein
MIQRDYKTVTKQRNGVHHVVLQDHHTKNFSSLLLIKESGINPLGFQTTTSPARVIVVRIAEELKSSRDPVV